MESLCCLESDYADKEKTIAGVISGRVARARHVDDDAQVVLVDAPQRLVAESSNKYSVEYYFRLGATPRRGAVWIEPTISDLTSLASDVQLEIDPSRVVLYNDETTVSVRVRVINPNGIPAGGGTVVIDNKIDSCDQAYLSLVSSTQVVIDVVAPKTSNSVPLVVVVLVAFFGILIAAVSTRLYIEHKRSKDDEIWLIKMSELKFKDPHEVVGRGTFGVVVLATYRGTQVAVKSVLPPRSGTCMFESISEQEGPDRPAPPSDGSVAESELGTSTLYPGTLSGPDSLRTKRNINRVNPRSKLRNAAKFFENDVSSRELGGQELTAKERRHHWERSLQFYSHSSASLRADFVAEMRHLSKLRHPCVTTCMGKLFQIDSLRDLSFPTLCFSPCGFSRPLHRCGCGQGMGPSVSDGIHGPRFAVRSSP